MVAGKRQAMDGVAVKANASMDSLKQKEVLDDGDDYSNELKDNEDGPDAVPSDDDKRINFSELNAVIKRGKPEDSQKERKKSGSNATHQSTTDKDARISVKPGKPRRLNYLAQVSVDTAHHVITQIQSEYADKRDSESLPSLLSNTIENLKEHGLKVEEVLADGNYKRHKAGK